MGATSVAIIVFGLTLWLVRSQATVSGPSFMRAMIPHHSIAIMVSERAQIRDARVRNLADEIIEAQRREIAEMRYLIADLAEGNAVEQAYQDPPARPGTVEDALSNTLIGQLHLEPVPAREFGDMLATGARCTFRHGPEADPVLWTDPVGGTAAIKLNGVLVRLEDAGAQSDSISRFATPGTALALRQLGNEADWRQNAELVLELDQGYRVGYRGFYDCGN